MTVSDHGSRRSETAVCVDGEAFRAAMALFASGVTIVTTRDPDGQPRGFTASAFSSVSLDPPLVLVCLDHGAQCRPSFVATDRFVVSVLRSGQEDAARRFASKRTDKFAEGGFLEVGELGHLAVEDALVVLECRMERLVPAGDHVVLIGAVESLEARSGVPMLHFRGEFWDLSGTRR